MTDGAAGGPVLLEEVQVSSREHLSGRPELRLIELFSVIEGSNLWASAGVGDADGSLRVSVGHRVEGRGAAEGRGGVRTAATKHRSVSRWRQRNMNIALN